MTHSLPPRGSHEPDDLMPGEAELKALYGKLPQNEPDPVLDATVLRAAADEVASGQDPDLLQRSTVGKRRGRPPRWLIGLSSAATLVLVAGLAWRTRSLPQAQSTIAVTGEISSATAANVAADTSGDHADEEIAPVAAPQTPTIQAMQPPRQLIIQKSPSQASLKAFAERATAPVLRHQAADRSAVRPAEATAALGEVESGRASAATEERSSADKVAAPNARVMSAARVAAAAPAPEFSQSAPPPAPPAPPAPVSAPALTQTAPTAPVNRADESRSQNASPAQSAELDAIRNLFAKHRDAEAQRRLEAFHRRHPQSQLPLDLQALLREP